MKRTVIYISFLLMLAGAGLAREKAQSGYPHVIQNVERVPIPLEGILAAPVPSPDGRYLAFTNDAFHGLYLYDFSTDTIRELSNLKGSGFGFVWSNNGLLAFRATLADNPGKHIICVAHADGVIEIATPLLGSLSLPLWADDNIYYVVWENESQLLTAGPDEKVAFDEVVFCHPSGRLAIFDHKCKAIESSDIFSSNIYFLPRLSKSGLYFLVHCLDGHMYLGTAGDERLTDIGQGSNARFGRNDEIIIFERTADDGHRTISSDLFFYEIATGMIVRLTDTSDRIERMPAMTDDGHTLFFEMDGKIMRGVVK